MRIIRNPCGGEGNEPSKCIQQPKIEVFGHPEGFETHHFGQFSKIFKRGKTTKILQKQPKIEVFEHPEGFETNYVG